MPYLTSSEEWQRQSTLLLNARPTTTRVTTKYHIPTAKASTDAKAAAPASTETQPSQPTAYLELKTYDPESGACLKYKTDKAAEVGRLIASLGSLGRNMAALPELQQDIAMPDAPASGAETPQAEGGLSTPAVEQKQQPTGGKKKKKGKK